MWIDRRTRSRNGKGETNPQNVNIMMDMTFTMAPATSMLGVPAMTMFAKVAQKTKNAQTFRNTAMPRESTASVA